MNKQFEHTTLLLRLVGSWYILLFTAFLYILAVPWSSSGRVMEIS